MSGRKWHLIPVTCGVLVTAFGVSGGAPSPVAADDPPDVVIDDFNAEGTVQAPCTTSNPEVVYLDDGNSLGGDLDLQVGCSPLATTGSVTATVGSGTLELHNTSDAAAQFHTSWDGVDGFLPVQTRGLGGVDLTAGGTKDSFTFALGTTANGLGGPGDPAPQIWIRVYGAAGTASQLMFDLPVEVTDTTFTLPFAGFEPYAPTPADFTDVGAIWIIVTDPNGGRQFTVGALTTTATARVPMSAAVAVDADGDGRPTPGDTIEYVASVANLSSNDLVPLDDASFLLPTPNGTLVPGSVTTTQGAVSSGNGPTDTGVRVDLGDVPGGASAEVRFRVVAGAAGALENQGHLEYRTTGSTTVSTSTDTDDPGTAAVSDRTVVQIAEPITLSIADAAAVTEGDGPATFVASLSMPAANSVSVTASTASGTATGDADFTSRVATIEFAPGEVTAEFVVDVVDDDEVEDPETFIVTLADAVGAVLDRSTAQATIVSEDTAPPTTPTTPAPPTTTDPPTTPAPPPTTAPLAPTVPATLPATGSDSSGLAIGALCALVLGSALALGVRRRRA